MKPMGETEKEQHIRKSARGSVSSWTIEGLLLPPFGRFLLAAVCRLTHFPACHIHHALAAHCFSLIIVIFRLFCYLQERSFLTQ